MALERKFFCVGSCQAVVSEEKFNSGVHVCGTSGCTHEGQTFEEGLWCNHCGRRVTEEEKAQHNH